MWQEGRGRALRMFLLCDVARAPAFTTKLLSKEHSLPFTDFSRCHRIICGIGTAG